MDWTIILHADQAGLELAGRKQFPPSDTLKQISRPIGIIYGEEQNSAASSDPQVMKFLLEQLENKTYDECCYLQN